MVYLNTCTFIDSNSTSCVPGSIFEKNRFLNNCIGHYASLLLQQYNLLCRKFCKNFAEFLVQPAMPVKMFRFISVFFCMVCLKVVAQVVFPF